MIAGLEISVWQAALGTALLVAVCVSALRGQFSALLAFVAGANLIGSAYFGDDVSKTMVLDVVCAAVLIGRGMTHDVVALIYVLMVPLYIPALLWGGTLNATYAIVEGLTYLQYAVIGGIGGGLIERVFRAGRRWRGDMGAQEIGRNAAEGAGLVAREKEVTASKGRAGS